MTKKAVLVVGHADPLSFNHRIASVYARGFSEAGGSVQRIDLADLKFDLVLRKGFREPQALEPDLLEARRAIEECNHLVWAFPTYWAAPPALVRGFFDRLFLPGWAFRYEKGRSLPVGLLNGRSSRVLLTMDSPGYWYSLYYGRSVHRSFGRGSLSFCGLSPLRFSTVYDMLHKGEEARARVLLKMEKVGRRDALSS